jgi:hypothetical protein
MDQLRPAIRLDETTQPIVGEQGQTHTQMIKVQPNPSQFSRDEQRGFVMENDPTTFLDRDQAAAKLGVVAPLHSEDLADLQATGEPKGGEAVEEEKGKLEVPPTVQAVEGEEIGREIREGVRRPDAPARVTATGGAPPAPPTAPPVPPPVTPDSPIVSEIANRYVAARVQAGDLGKIYPGRGASAQDLSVLGQKLVEQHGEPLVDQAVSRVMTGIFDPVNDAGVVRFQEARLRARKDQMYQNMQQNPVPENQLAYENAFKDLTDFHQGPIAQVKANWAQAGRGLQGQFPVDVSTADGLREAWLQNTGKDVPPEVRPLMEKTARTVRDKIDQELDVKGRLSRAIDQEVARRRGPKHEEIRNRFMQELENRPCL